MEEKNMNYIGSKDLSRLGPDDGPDDDLHVMSEEESLAFHRARLEKRITPELLSYFSRGSTERLVKYFDQCPSQKTFGVGQTYSPCRLKSDSLDFLKKEIGGKRVIELGSAGSGDSRSWFRELGASEYLFADPSYNIDALTFLRRQSDESAIVTSFGVFEDGVLYNAVDELGKYNQLLGKEIYRVTPRESITFHGLEYISDISNAGFKKPEGIPQELNDNTIGSVSRYLTLRK